MFCVETRPSASAKRIYKVPENKTANKWHTENNNIKLSPR